MGPIGFPKTSVINYDCSLCNNPEEHRSHTVFILTYLHVVRKEIMYLMMVCYTYDYLVSGLFLMEHRVQQEIESVFFLMCTQIFHTISLVCLGIACLGKCHLYLSLLHML